MLYHQSYLTDFQKLSFCWKMWKKGILGRKSDERSYFSFAMARWKLIRSREMLKFPHFQALHCVGKNVISPKVFKRFSKTSLLLKDVENRYSGGKFLERSYFSFGMARWKLYSSWREMLKFPHLQALHLCHKKSLYHQRYSTDFQKLSFCCKMWKIGIWAEKILSAAILVLQWQGENY